MDDRHCRDFFLKPPVETAQRHYELLRAVFVDGVSQPEAAARFGYTHGSVRQLLHTFRKAVADGSPPPFFDSSDRVDHRRKRSWNPPRG